LERMPKRGQAFEDGARELARRLGLTSEWWTGNSVLDRGPRCHPDGYIANSDHARCREVRLALLDAVDPLGRCQSVLKRDHVENPRSLALPQRRRNFG